MLLVTMLWGHNILIKASGDVIDRSGGIVRGHGQSPVIIADLPARWHSSALPIQVLLLNAYRQDAGSFK